MTCAPVPQTVPYWPYWSNSRIQATLTRFHYVSPWLLRDCEKNKQGEPISRWTNLKVNQSCAEMNVTLTWGRVCFSCFFFTSVCSLSVPRATSSTEMHRNWMELRRADHAYWHVEWAYGSTHMLKLCRNAWTCIDLGWNAVKCLDPSQIISNHLKPTLACAGVKVYSLIFVVNK